MAKESLHCLEVLVHSISDLSVPCSSPAIAVRFLDFPTLLLRPKLPHDPIDDGTHVPSDQTSRLVKFGAGKSCLFRMSISALEEALLQTPLFAMLVDVGKDPCVLLGSTAIPANECAASLSSKVRQGDGFASSTAYAWRESYSLRTLMGSCIGHASITCRFVHLGCALGAHSHMLQSAGRTGFNDGQAKRRDEEKFMSGNVADNHDEPGTSGDHLSAVSMPTTQRACTDEKKSIVITSGRQNHRVAEKGDPTHMSQEPAAGERFEEEHLGSQKENVLSSDSSLAKSVNERFQEFPQESQISPTVKEPKDKLDDLYLPNTCCPPPLFYESPKKSTTDTLDKEAQEFGDFSSLPGTDHHNASRSYFTKEHAAWQDIGKGIGNNFAINNPTGQLLDEDARHNQQGIPQWDSVVSQAGPEQPLPLLAGLLQELLTLQRSPHANQSSQPMAHLPHEHGTSHAHQPMPSRVDQAFHYSPSVQQQPQQTFRTGGPWRGPAPSQFLLRQAEAHFSQPFPGSHQDLQYYSQPFPTHATQPTPTVGYQDNNRSAQLTALLSHLLSQCEQQQQKLARQELSLEEGHIQLDSSMSKVFAPRSSPRQSGQSLQADSSSSSCYQPKASSPRARAVIRAKHDSYSSTSSKSSLAGERDGKKMKRRISSAKRKRSSITERLADKPPLPASRQQQTKEWVSSQRRHQSVEKNTAKSALHHWKTLHVPDDGHLGVSDSSAGRPRILVFLPSQTETSAAAVDSPPERHPGMDLSESARLKRSLLAAWPVTPLSDSAQSSIQEKKTKNELQMKLREVDARLRTSAVEASPRHSHSDESGGEDQTVRHEAESMSSEGERAGESAERNSTISSQSDTQESSERQRVGSSSNTGESLSTTDEGDTLQVDREEDSDIHQLDDTTTTTREESEAPSPVYTDDFDDDSLASPLPSPELPRKAADKTQRQADKAQSSSTSYSVDTADIVLSTDSKDTDLLGEEPSLPLG